MTENAPLGNTTKSSSTQSPRALYADVYKLLSASQHLLQKDNHRVCVCCNHRTPNTDTIKITRSSDATKASFSGVMKCGDIWACPVCARKVSEQRRIELNQAVEAAKSLGYRVPMLTLTHAHTSLDTLPETRKLMQKAYGRLTSGRWWQEFKDEYCVIGTIRAFEVTYGDKNGWHVHWHVMLVIDPSKATLEYQKDFDPIAMEITLKKRWGLTLHRLGGFASEEHGARVTEHENEVADYIAKFGYTPSGVESKARSKEQWTESHELAKNVSKRARGKYGRTPFQILEDYADGDKQSGALFVEYVKAMKHARQLVWSDGLKDLLLGGETASDQDIADEIESEIVVEIEPKAWRVIVRYRLRGKLLDLACQRKDAEISAIIQKCEDVEWTQFRKRILDRQSQDNKSSMTAPV